MEYTMVWALTPISGLQRRVMAVMPGIDICITVIQTYVAMIAAGNRAVIVSVVSGIDNSLESFY